MSIGNPRWPPLQDTLLTQDYMGKYRNILLSETTELIEPKLYMDVLWIGKELSNDQSFTVWVQSVH
jgi:hypothetical protein